MSSLPAAKHRTTGWRVFAIFASLAAVAAIAFALDAVFKPFGLDGRAVVDNLGQILAAAIAAAACAWGATRAAKRERRAWTLLALSAGALGLGQVIYAYYDLVLATPNSVPAVVQLAYIGGGPLAFAAVLSFWDAPRGTATRWSVWLDALIIVLSLTFTEWALDLKTIFLGALQTADQQIAGYLPAYFLFIDILIGTVLILAIRRATHHQAGRMLLVLGGMAAVSLSDSTFAYLSVNNAYTSGDVVDSGWVVGYLMIALAAIWPVSEVSTRRRNTPVDLWQLALPLGTVVVAAVTCLGLAFSGRSLDGVMTAIVGATSILLTVRVITANREAVAMLMKSRESEGNLAEVIARAPTGFVRIGTDFAIIEANPQFSALLAAVGETLIGAPITRYFSPEDGRQFVERLQALMSGAVDTVDSDSEAHRADGTVVWLHWSATVVHAVSGGRDYFIAMFEDTTARHDSEAAAVTNLGLMQRLNSLKTNFLQSVSHEFKTALLGIQGFSELLRDDSEMNAADVRTFAADINNDAVRLDRMVTEMLELDRVETGRADLRLAPLDLNDLVRREADISRQQQDRIVIELSLDSSLTTIPGDEPKLSEVIRTLLGNAVARSPVDGKVTVSTVVSGPGVGVYVKDEGVGVRAEFDDRLFDQDDLYANSPIRRVLGTGLGLGMARQIVQMHGGRLWVLRTPEGGSEYRFTLPVPWRARVASSAPPPEPAAVA